MLFKLHYWCLTAGASAIGILMGVYITAYTDASPSEIGTLLMLMPFTGLIFRPIICSKADREQAHQKYLIYCLSTVSVSYLPFIVIPFFGPAAYEEHPRVCWYILVVFKVVGDIAFGGVVSLGDALAINYAERLGIEYRVYRVWGTISWLVFGIIIGQVNEIWFLPKYVPAFMILIAANMLDLAVVWLWPNEYFVMKPRDPNEEEGKEKESSYTKSLMPKEVVWAHAKSKLLWLATFGAHEIKDANELLRATRKQLPQTISILGQADLKRNKEEQLEEASGEKQCVDKETQFKILVLLLRKDARILGYLLFFLAAGLSLAPLSFFFVSLSEICSTGGACNFSQLAGFLQVSMAASETVLFVYVKRIQLKLGRLQMCLIALLLATGKYTFYATIWPQVNPNYALLLELCHGFYFGIFVSLGVELGHKFANLVGLIQADLVREGLAKDEADAERFKLALAATMQSLIASAQDGCGRGFGALIIGFILEFHSFQVLWAIVAVSLGLASACTAALSLTTRLFGLHWGLESRKKAETARQISEVGKKV